MSETYRILLGFHVVVGSLALLTFWGAMLARKGGRLHRRFGRGFAVTMATTLVTAAILCAVLLADPLAARPPETELGALDRTEHARVSRELGSGLLEVSVVTGALLYFGLRALRRRRGLAASDRNVDLAVACGVTSAGLVFLALGFDPDLPHFEGRGVVASVVGALQIRALVRPNRSRSSWLVEHLVGLMGAAAIGHGALTVNVAGRFTDDLGLAFGASVPTLLAFALAIGWTARRWRRKLEGAPSPRGKAGDGAAGVPPRVSPA